MSKRIRAQRSLPKKWAEWADKANSAEWIRERENRAREREYFQWLLRDVYTLHQSAIRSPDEPSEASEITPHRQRDVHAGPRGALQLVERMVPRRLACEEIGDAEELIDRIACEPAGRFKLARVCWVCFRASIVVLWNAFWYAVDRALKRRTE